MRAFLPFAALTLLLPGSVVALVQLVNHCGPDGAAGFICQRERAGPPELTPQMTELIRNTLRSQIPTIPYIMTPDEMTDMERNGGTATNEERIAQPGSQFQECENRLARLGYGHADQSNTCNGLSIHAPTPKQQAEFTKSKNAEDAARFAAIEEVWRKQGEALRNKIAADRAKQ